MKVTKYIDDTVWDVGDNFDLFHHQHRPSILKHFSANLASAPTSKVYFINIKILSTISWICHQLYFGLVNYSLYVLLNGYQTIHENGIEGLHWIHTKVKMHVLKRCKFLWFGIFVPNMLLKLLKYGVYLGRRTLIRAGQYFSHWKCWTAGRYAGNHHGEIPRAEYCL